jgi:hypothetical protein
MSGKGTTHTFRPFFSILLGTLIGVATLALTNFDPLWNWLKVPANIRDPLTLGMSIFFLLVGFLLAFYFQQADAATTQAAENERFRTGMLQSIPQLTLFTMYNGGEAIRFISEVLGKAKIVLNTRIFTGTYNPNEKSLQLWDSAICDAVNERLFFKEVVSEGNRDLVSNRIRATSNSKGTYQGAWVDYQLPGFLNFIILEFSTGLKEVWLGWRISPGVGFECPVVRTNEAHVVAIFENWHHELYAKAEQVSS